MSKQNPEAKFTSEIFASLKAYCENQRRQAPASSPFATPPLIQKFHGSVAQVNLPDAMIVHNATVFFVEFKFIRRPMKTLDVILALDLGQRVYLERIVANGADAIVVVGLEKYGVAVCCNLSANSEGGKIPTSIKSTITVDTTDYPARPITTLFDWTGVSASGKKIKSPQVEILTKGTGTTWHNVGAILRPGAREVR